MNHAGFIVAPVERTIIAADAENATVATAPVNPAHYQPTPMEKFERFFEELSWKIRRSINRSFAAHRRKGITKKKRSRSPMVELDEKTEYWVEEFEIIGADELEEKRKQSEAEETRPRWISTSTEISGGRPKVERRKSTGALLQFLTNQKSSPVSPPSMSAGSPSKPKPKRRGTWKF